MPSPRRTIPLPADKVRFAGEAVAMVVANSIAAAKTGAELVAVEYEPLDPVTRSLAVGRARRAVRVQGRLQCLRRRRRRRRRRHRGGVQARRACGVARHARCSASPACRWSRAPRSASTTPATGRYTLHAGSGNVVRQKAELSGILGVAENAVRVIARDVGGNFGTRNAFYPEFALVCWAARRLSRPVKWTCERSESFLSDYQGRDLAVQAELALDADGHFLALRGTNTSNVGAHTVSFVALVQGRRADVQRLQDPGGAFPRPRRHDQYAADQFLSQRRPARGDVRDRAADRSRRRPMRLRPRVAAAAQPRAGAAALLRQSARPHLRRRRLQEGDGRRARARRLAGLCEAQARVAAARASCAASASPTISS